MSVPKTRQSVLGSSFKVAAGLVFLTVVGLGLWRASATSATTEPYTELYFNRNLALPTSLDESPLTFSFTIRNAEGQTKQYPYLVVLKRPNGTTATLKSGSLALADGASTRVPLSLTLPAGTMAPSELSVLLPDQQQEIHFWLGTKQ